MSSSSDIGSRNPFAFQAAAQSSQPSPAARTLRDQLNAFAGTGKKEGKEKGKLGSGLGTPVPGFSGKGKGFWG